MTGPIARIIVRYGAGALVALGLVSAMDGKGIAADQDLVAVAQVLVGFLGGIIAEGWYVLARKYGWAK